MEYLTHFITFLAGLGTGWTLKLAISSHSENKSRHTKTTQINNKSGGDMAGGDINK